MRNVCRGKVRKKALNIFKVLDQAKCWHVVFHILVEVYEKRICSHIGDRQEV